MSESNMVQATTEQADNSPRSPGHGIRLLVCGGRYFANPTFLWRSLDEIDATRGRISCVIEGASDDVTGPYVGADYWAHQWALARDRPYERHHAEWKIHGTAAGPIRNRNMRDKGKPDLVVSFPGDKGTRGMIEIARAGSIQVLELRPR